MPRVRAPVSKGSSMAKKRVLVVDDELDFVRMIKARLEANNYSVFTAGDGKEVLKRIRAEKPEVILLDILIPKPDGLEVLKAIRKLDKNIPVFILTAYADQKKFNRAKKLGASGFIVKTSDLQKEINNITSALRISANYRGTTA